MIERTPGEGAYARAERERRWLLRGVPDGVTDPVEILDTYFLGSTLRLRRLRRGAATFYKLGQKVRPDPARPSLVHLTNLYLSEPEYALLGTLDGGATLVKTRWRWSLRDTVFAVDEFGGALGGLVLAEIELAEGEAPSLPPALAAADVTEDDRFSGGRLAALGPTDARIFLEEVATSSSGGSG